MPEATLTLNTLFGLPNEAFARKALAVGVEQEELDSLKGQVMSAVKGLAWSAVEDDIFKGIAETLNTDLLTAVAAAWEKYNVLKDHAAQSTSSGEAAFVELIDHTLSLELHPYVKIEWTGFSKEIIFDVTMEVTLKGLQLRIENARIMAVQTGACEGKGEISLKGHSLLSVPFKPVELPGRVNLGKGIPIA
jgi:hypothetical protein